MTTKELKYSIVENIEDINDEKILNTIKSVLENYKTEPIIISDKRKEILDYAKQQIKNNEFVSDKDLNREEDEWLKE